MRFYHGQQDSELELKRRKIATDSPLFGLLTFVILLALIQTLDPTSRELGFLFLGPLLLLLPIVATSMAAICLGWKSTYPSTNQASNSSKKHILRNDSKY